MTEDLSRVGISLCASRASAGRDVFAVRRETQEVVREALDAGAQGVIFVSSLQW